MFARFRSFAEDFDAQRVDRERFEEYSARSVALRLANALNEAVSSDVPDRRRGEGCVSAF
jgi:hypothetical protein